MRAAVGTSLPPHVPGNIQGWLHAELLDFTDAVGASPAQGTLDWWGQDTPGVLLEVRQPGHLGVANVQFPIRSSPKRFMAYIQDMQFLRVHLYHPGEAANKQMGLCEIKVLPFLRGPDSDYKLQLDGYFPVVRSHSDRMVIGQLRLVLHTEWGEHAELRSKQDALSSFEAHEWKAKLEAPRPAELRSSRNSGGDLEATSRWDQHGSRQVPQGLHLQVHLCGMRMWAQALHTNEDLTITYRLGPKEEASVTAVLQDEGHEVCSLLGSVRTSGMPIWPEGAGGQPTLKSLHFHFWQNSRLLGLAAVKLPATLTDTLSAQCLLLSSDVKVSSLSSGEVIGLLKLALYVGPEALQTPSQLTSLPAPLESPHPDALDVARAPEPKGSRQRDVRIARVDAIPQVDARTDLASATLCLVASGTDGLLAECRANGYPSSPSILDLEDFCQGLLRRVDGLTPHQAALLASEAKCAPDAVSLDLWKGVFREAVARVEAAIDLLQEVIGEELGWLVEQLGALGMALLPHNELVALLSKRSQPTWGLVEEMLRLLDPGSQPGKGELPARPLARLLSKRADTFWKKTMHSVPHSVPPEKHSHSETHCENSVPPVADFNVDAAGASFIAPQLFAARQLISALLCLIRAGELDVTVVSKQLDTAALQVSERKPALWCSLSPEPVVLATILETDAEGTSRALEVWQGLHLPTSASAAVQALRSLSTVEFQGVPGVPRLRAHQTIQDLARSRSGFGQLPPSCRTAVFQSLLGIGMGPEQLRSRLRTTCGAAGPNKLYLDQFASCLQKSGVTMAWADLLEVGRQWAPEGLLDVDALYADHRGWLALRSTPYCPEALSMFDASSMGQFSRLDLPSYVLFACLDAENQGHVSEEILRKLEEWPSPVAQFVSGAQLLYDPSGHGVVTYAHFRRFCNYLDRLRPAEGTLQEARAEIRQALVNLCGTRHSLDEDAASQTSQGHPSQHPSRGLDAGADLSGLVRLLQDSVGLRRDLAETFAGAFLAVRAPNSSNSTRLSSYRAFLIMATQSQVLLRRHVDDLFKACLAASVDLELVLSDLMPGPILPGTVLGWDVLLSALAAKGVDISKMDTEEVACAIDSSGRRAVVVSDLAAAAKAFRTRHSSVLEHLANAARDASGLFHLVSHKATGP